MKRKPYFISEPFGLPRELQPTGKFMTEEEMKRKNAIHEFENMRDMAELKALSKISLERPLSESEYRRMMELGKKKGLVKVC
jgi:hypothetical protein